MYSSVQAPEGLFLHLISSDVSIQDLGGSQISKLSQERGRNARRSPFKSAIEANNHHMLF